MLQQRFRQIELFVTLFEMSEQFEHRARTFAVIQPARFCIKRLVISRRVETAASEQFIKRIAQSLLCKPGLQSSVSKRVFAKLAQNMLIFETGDEFDLAKLHRLKAAGRIQLIAKPEKVDRRHCLEQLDLVQQDLLDFHHPLQRALCGDSPIFVHQPYALIYYLED